MSLASGRSAGLGKEPPLTDRAQCDGVLWPGAVVSWFRGGSGETAGFPAEVAQGTQSRGCAVAICTYCRAESLSRLLTSLLQQDRQPDELVIVDASPDSQTEVLVGGHPVTQQLGDRLLYFRLGKPLQGLTRQRNFALHWIKTDLVAFFDDDVLLQPHCLRIMEQTHREEGDRVVGVGACVQNQQTRPTPRWRLRRFLGLVPKLQPGKYYRSGHSIPWSFLPLTEGTVEGDWLPGGATMWKTEAARATRFNDQFEGYGSSEDLDFSLRIAKRGKLLLAGSARVLHLHEPAGRPGISELAYTHLRNAYRVHLSCLPDRRWTDTIWFLYAVGIDTILQSASLFRPTMFLDTLSYLTGRLRFVGHWVRSAGRAW
jgi:GT2 family glycosyltransferase